MTSSDDCRARILAGRSSEDTVQTFAISSERHQVGEGIVVAFDCGKNWIADFEEGFGSLTGIEHIQGEIFSVVARGAAYIVNALTESCERIPGLITAYVRNYPHGIVLATQTDILLRTASKTAWRTKVSDDGVTLLTVTSEAVQCNGWDAPTNTNYTFEIAMSSGEVLSRRLIGVP